MRGFACHGEKVNPSRNDSASLIRTGQEITLTMNTKRTRDSITRLIETARFAIPLARDANRRLSLMQMASTMMSAIATPMLVVVLGAAVGEIEASIAAGKPDVRVLDRWIWFAGVAGVLIATAEGSRRYCRQRLVDEVRLKVNQQVVAHAATLDLQLLERCRTQDSFTRAMKDPGTPILEASHGMLETVSSGFQAVGLIGVLIWIEPRWSAALGLLAIPFLAAQWSLSKAGAKQIRMRMTATRWSSYYAKTLGDHQIVPTIRLLRLAPLFLERFQETIRQTLTASRRLYRQQMVMQLVANILATVALCFVVRLVGRAAQLGAVSVGSFVAYWTAAWRLRTALTRLSDSMSAVFDAHFAIVQIREFLSLRSTQSSGQQLRLELLGRIEFHNASYLYPGADRPAVDQVSLTIEPGEVVALVGPNGAGKTTLARLITRLYDVSDGAIQIDGHDLRDWDIDALHRQMSVVFQEPIRFEATALESVAFGDWERLLANPDRVREICQQTGLDPILSALPRGYETHLGRRFGDCDLSGGQWRRLAVTQALARDPRVIVLDEPYANLDPVAEEELYQSIERLLKGRTAILISHRFSTLRLADRIVAMDAGRIIEQGTHDELLRRDGLYASLYRTSMARFDLSAVQRKCA